MPQRWNVAISGEVLLERWRAFIEKHKKAPTESGGVGHALAALTRNKLAAGHLTKSEITELDGLKIALAAQAYNYRLKIGREEMQEALAARRGNTAAGHVESRDNGSQGGDNRRDVFAVDVLYIMQTDDTYVIQVSRTRDTSRMQVLADGNQTGYIVIAGHRGRKTCMQCARRLSDARMHTSASSVCVDALCTCGIH